LALRAKTVFVDTLTAIQDAFDGDYSLTRPAYTALKEVTACKGYTGEEDEPMRDLCKLLMGFMVVNHWQPFIQALGPRIKDMCSGFTNLLAMGPDATLFFGPIGCHPSDMEQNAGGIWHAIPYGRPPWVTISSDDKQSGWRLFQPTYQQKGSTVAYPNEWIPPIFHKVCALTKRQYQHAMATSSQPKWYDYGRNQEEYPFGNKPHWELNEEERQLYQEWRQRIACKQQEETSRYYRDDQEWTTKNRAVLAAIPSVVSLVEQTFKLWDTFIEDMDAAMVLYNDTIAATWTKVKAKLIHAQAEVRKTILEMEEYERRPRNPVQFFALVAPAAAVTTPSQPNGV
jgi:hypothetical protein